MERERCCQARNATAARHWACDKAKEPGRVALHRLLSRMLLLTAAMVLVASVIVVVPAHASADVALNTYTAPDGSKQFISDGGTMPIGSTLQIGVFVSLDSCDPVTVSWGDGASGSRNYGGFLAENWQHTYNSSGTFTISASEPCGSGTGQTRTISVASSGGLFGGGGLFDTSGSQFIPTIFGLIFGFIGLVLALANPRIPVSASFDFDKQIHQSSGSPFTPTPINPTTITPTEINPVQVDSRLIIPRTVTPTMVVPTPITPTGFDPAMTTLPSMVANLVSYSDIPTGAPRQDDPRIKMDPGKATDLNQLVACPTCGGRLGYVAGGWFCLNPACPLRQL